MQEALYRARESNLTWSPDEERRVREAKSALQRLDMSSPVLSVFDVIRALFPFVAGMVDVLHASSPTEPANFVCDMPEGWLSERALLMHEDPSVPMVAQGPIGFAVRGTDAMGDDFLQSPYNQAMYPRFGFDNVTGMILSKGVPGVPDEVAVLWMFNERGARVGSWRDCRLLDVIGGDIRQAMMRARLPLAMRNDLLFQTMQEQDVGYVVVRATGGLLEANRRAVLLAQKYFSRVGGSWRSHVAALISAVQEADRRDGLICHRMRCPDGWDVLDAYTHNLAKECHDAGEDITLIQLRETLRNPFSQLPPRQREIAGYLAYSELSNKEIADVIGIAEGTLRKHEERIHKALGVHSRPELVVMAMGYLPPRPRR